MVLSCHSTILSILLHRSLQGECGTPLARKVWHDATMSTFSPAIAEKPDVTATALLFERTCDKRLPLITGYA